MSKFSRLVRVVATDDSETYFADAGSLNSVKAGTKVQGFRSIHDLGTQAGREIVVAKVGHRIIIFSAYSDLL